MARQHMDPYDIQVLLGPSSRAISENLKFIRNYRQGQQTATTDDAGSTGSTTGGASGNTTPQPSANPGATVPAGAMPAEQAMYMQGLYLQMQQSLIVMQQIGGIFAALQKSGIDFEECGLTPEQKALLNQLYPNLAGQQNSSNNNNNETPPDQAAELA